MGLRIEHITLRGYRVVLGTQEDGISNPTGGRSGRNLHAQALYTPRIGLGRVHLEGQLRCGFESLRWQLHGSQEHRWRILLRNVAQFHSHFARGAGHHVGRQLHNALDAAHASQAYVDGRLASAICANNSACACVIGSPARSSQNNH